MSPREQGENRRFSVILQAADGLQDDKALKFVQGSRFWTPPGGVSRMTETSEDRMAVGGNGDLADSGRVGDPPRRKMKTGGRGNDE